MNFNILLLEAAEYNDEYELAKAILRGQIPGVSAKKFFGEDRVSIVEKAVKDKTTSMPTSALKQIIRYKESFKKQDQNAAIALILKKSGYWSKLPRIDEIDPYISYFSNRNKKEVKENEEIKKLFKKFEEVNSEDDFNKVFEQKINEIFADKATLKSDKEIELIYPEDENGWSILSPKTFAAAKMLACMNNRKANWCTSAKSRMFDYYTNNGNNKLFIIKNKKMNKMFQMDFGKEGFPNFKNEDDSSTKISVIETEIPSYIFDIIKNEKGVSINQILKNNEKNNLSNIDGEWKLEEIKSTKKITEIIQKYKLKKITIKEKYFEKALLEKKIYDIYYLLYNNRKKYFFSKKQDERIIFELFDNKNEYSSVQRKKESLLNENLPKHIKKVIFNVDVDEKPNYKKIQFENVDFYILNNKEAFYKFASQDIFDKIKKDYSENKNEYKNNEWPYSKNEKKVKSFLGKNIKILYFKGNLRDLKTSFKYFINLINGDIITSDEEFENIFINKNFKFNKIVMNFLKNNYPFIYKKYDATPIPTEDLIKKILIAYKYKIFNLDGKKVVLFKDKDSIVSFLKEKNIKLNFDLAEKNGAGYKAFNFENVMNYENNTLKKMSYSEFENLAKKYSFLKNLPLKRINLYFKDEESFKNTKNPLDETRKIYKKTVANKVLNKIKE